jgi:hypothetical protein
MAVLSRKLTAVVKDVRLTCEFSQWGAEYMIFTSVILTYIFHSIQQNDETEKHF